MTTQREASPATLGELLERARLDQGLGRERAAVAMDSTSTTYRAWLRYRPDDPEAQQPSMNHAPAIIRFTGEDPVVVLRAMGVPEEDIAILRGGRPDGGGIHGSNGAKPGYHAPLAPVTDITEWVRRPIPAPAVGF